MEYILKLEKGTDYNDLYGLLHHCTNDAFSSKYGISITNKRLLKNFENIVEKSKEREYSIGENLYEVLVYAFNKTLSYNPGSKVLLRLKSSIENMELKVDHDEIDRILTRLKEEKYNF